MSTQVLHGDCRDVLKTLPDESVNCILSSPPYYGLRDYKVDGQIGLEQTPDEYVAELVDVFHEARRVLRKDGVFWLNLGDSYAGSGKGAWNNKNGGQKEVYIPDADSPQTRIPKVPSGLKPKDLIGIPWMVAFALRSDGWWLRQDNIWNKPNPMPESVRDRTTRAHEYVFMLTKSANYLYDAEAIAEDAIYSGVTGMDESGFKNAANFSGKHSGVLHSRNERADKQRGHGRRHAGFNDRWDAMTKEEQGSGKRNKRSVWEIATRPFADAHFATMAPELARICIMAGCPIGGTVLDPFGGAGTSALVADQLQRNAIIIELNPEYAEMARKRVQKDAGMFADA